MTFEESLPLRQLDLGLKQARAWDLLRAYKRALVQACRSTHAMGASPVTRLFEGASV
jgi:hypothetical protein